jgi:hypothetical protein
MDPGSGNNLGENFNPGSNNPGGGSNPGGGNNPGGDRNVMSIQNILNDTSINYNTLSPAQMHNILVTKQGAIQAQRNLDGARSLAVSLNDAGYHFTRNQHTNFDWARVHSDQQTLFYLYRDNRDLFARKAGDTNIAKIIEYYRNIM